VIPTANAGNVDARARDLCLYAVLCGDQLLGIGLTVAAYFNKRKLTVLDQIKAFRRVIVLYSSNSHSRKSFPFEKKSGALAHSLIVPYQPLFVNPYIQINTALLHIF
jgi:hypothetical protein